MSRSIKKRLEFGLWIIGALLLGYTGYVLVEGQLGQRRGGKDLDRILNSKRIEIIPRQPQPATAPPYGELVGRLEIPRLGLSLITFEGTDEPVLKKGVGHLTGSALPGDSGNVVLAAHRDTFFRKLKDIQEGDEITVTTPVTAKRYIVESTKIIDPKETQVLNATSSPTLTLITCYPFYFVGHAPKRFVVIARPAPGSNLPNRVVADATPPASLVRLSANSTLNRTPHNNEAPRQEPIAAASRRPSRRSVSEGHSVADPGPAAQPPMTLIELPQDDQPAVQPKRGWNPTRIIAKLNFFGKKKNPNPSTLADSRKSQDQN